MSASPLAGLAFALLLCASPAWASVCAPVRVGSSVASLPSAWRRAVEDLVQDASSEGRPWSCSGGAIDLVLREGGAVLTVTTAGGNAVTREVSLPEEVVPLGQALLAMPVAIAPRAEAPRAEAPRAGDAPGPAPSAAAPPFPAPRALVSAVIAPRYAGSANLVWGGVAASIAVPFGAWAVGGMVRYDGPAAAIGKREAHIQEVVVGGAASRTFASPRFELRASVLPEVAIVTRGVRPHVDETHVDGRLGFEARGAIPFTPLVRGVVVLDGDLAPGQVRGDEHRVLVDAPTPYPSYTLGLGVGVEFAIR